MKRASSYVLAFFLATGLALAQAGGGARKASTELNPQPLPPGKSAPKASTELNPQPLPPGRSAPKASTELNPQPLPPGKSAPKASTALNPQPLPPGRKIQMQSKTNASSEKAYKAAKKSREGAGATS